MKPEQQTQCAILDWLAAQYPIVREHVVKIDNEGIRSIAGHRLASKMGLHKGASDLFIAWPTIEHSGLWIEIKRDGWRVNGNKENRHVQLQQQFLKKMKDVGYAAAFVVGVDDGINAIRKYLE